MKRIVSAALTLLLLLSLAVPAGAAVVPGSNHSRVLIEEDQVEVYLKALEEWTIVTPDQIEERMDLLTQRGETPADVRARFAYGNIVFEAYHPKLFPYGVVRVQRFEDEISRNYWNSNDLNYYQMERLIGEFKGTLYQGYLNLFHLHRAEYTNGLYGSVIWYPPFEYESGLCVLYILNGVTYLVSYTQRTPASAQRFFSVIPGYNTDPHGHPIDEMTYSHIRGYLPVVLQSDGVQIVGQKLTPVADLSTDGDRLILNAHSGPFTMTGSTEAGAQVAVSRGDESWQATVNADGAYTCEITLVPGENEIVSTASKPGLGDNTLSRAVSADDTMAALELTAFPYGREIRDQLRVKGKASPGATVLVQVDEQEPAVLTVGDDGAFDHPFTVQEDWVDHDITITAQEAGLSDCTAKFTFSATYDEAQRGIYYYKQTLTPNLTAKDILADPAAHVGSRVGLDVHLVTVDYRDGVISCEGRIDQDPQKNIVLIFDDYMEDEITRGMLITVYGELEEPTRTDPPVARLNVEYVYNLIVEYVYR